MQIISNKEVKCLQGVNDRLLKRVVELKNTVKNLDSKIDPLSPSLDILTPLKPMTAGKSYTSAVALDGKIFVLGGGDGACWFDTGTHWFLCSVFDGLPDCKFLGPNICIYPFS